MLSHTSQLVQSCILPHSETGPVDPSNASLWEGAAWRRPGAGLVCLALSYQPLRLCIQSVAAPTFAAAAFSDGKHCFPLGLKIDPSRALLPSALLDNC